MKSVTADPVPIELLGNREMIGKRTVTAVESCIKAGDLGKVWRSRQQRANRREIVRLMQRRKTHICFQDREHGPIYQDRSIVIGSTVNHTMADGDHVELLILAQPAPCFGDRSSDVRHLVARILFVDQDSFVVSLGAQTRPGTDAIHLSLDEPRQACISVNPEDLKFDTGRTGVDDKYCVHGTSYRRYCHRATASVGTKDCSRARCHTAAN